MNVLDLRPGDVIIYDHFRSLPECHNKSGWYLNTYRDSMLSHEYQTDIFREPTQLPEPNLTTKIKRWIYNVRKR